MRNPERRVSGVFDSALRLCAVAVLSLAFYLPEKGRSAKPLAIDMPGSGRIIDEGQATTSEKIDWHIRELKIKEGIARIQEIVGEREVVPAVIAVIDGGWCPEAWPEELLPATITDTLVINQPPANCYEHGVAITAIAVGEQVENNIGGDAVCPKELCHFFVVNAASGKEYLSPNGFYVFNYSDLAMAVSWVANFPDTEGNTLVDVISMSWGGKSDATSLRNAIELAKTLGILLVAGTGNDGENSCLYPANYAGVLAVGAVGHANPDPEHWDKDLAVPGFSNWCDNQPFVAPGVSIAAPQFDENEQITLELIAGTSASTPQISGMLGILISFLRTMGVERETAKNSALEALIASATIPTYVAETQRVRWGSAGMPDFLLAAKTLIQEYGFTIQPKNYQIFLPQVTNEPISPPTETEELIFQ